MKAITVVTDPWDGTQSHMADTVFDKDRDTHSKLLGPDGNPLPYAPRQAIGFNLTPRQKG